ncbi:MAG: zinc ribbon domain-containing protein [Gammaproteobacteria bacterium]|nr:zinc ribbon domain-containing protein [Gammaproteobacteria bacterium]
MPIYEYQCTACGHRFDKLQKISDAQLADCPACKQPKLHKLVSAAGFQLKGNGWYVTDFRDQGKKPAAETKAATAAPTETKTETPAANAATESKPGAAASHD